MPRRSTADAKFYEEYPYLTEKERFLIGWPGYRTRIDKTGFSVPETQAEWGHMQGVMIRMLMTGCFKVRNPFYLLFLTVVGVIYALPLPFIIYELLLGNVAVLYLLFSAGPYIAVGVLVLWNVILSIARWDEESSITGD